MAFMCGTEHHGDLYHANSHVTHDGQPIGFKRDASTNLRFRDSRLLDSYDTVLR